MRWSSGVAPGIMRSMIRTVTRQTPMTSLRIWTQGDSPDRSRLSPESVVVEWVGRTGHPTSYALLGLSPAAAADPGPRTGETFDTSLAGDLDDVVFGLPGEYESAVADVLDHSGADWRVTVAAHGRFGSSQVAFRLVAAALRRLLPVDVDQVPGEGLWEVWDEVVAEVR